MDVQLRRSLDQTVYKAGAASISSQGDITYASPTSLSARVEAFEQNVDTKDGRAVKTTHLIVCETAIDKADRVWLPGVDQTNSALAREVLSAASFTDGKGAIDHYEVYV